jgi:hypothetical protein
MVGQLRIKLESIRTLLWQRQNKSYQFFDKLIIQIDSGQVMDAVELIIPAYAMTQYADLTMAEEKLFDEIWTLANELRHKL